MRITSGFARGILLDSPRGKSTRPATDAARQAIFSSLGGIVEGASVIDLFAGTGSYGLEAASRGAASVLFFENDRNALGALRANLERVKKAVNSAKECSATPTEKLLEIVIITYNRKREIKQTLESLMASYSPVRRCPITILDNCSTDGASEVCAEFAEKYENITHIRHPQNIGGNANICRAFEIAKEEYIWCLSDDDGLDWSAWQEIEEAMEAGYDQIQPQYANLTINKANQEAPLAPVVTDVTDTTITIEVEEGVAYSIDGGKTWQTGTLPAGSDKITVGSGVEIDFSGMIPGESLDISPAEKTGEGEFSTEDGTTFFVKPTGIYQGDTGNPPPQITISNTTPGSTGAEGLEVDAEGSFGSNVLVRFEGVKQPDGSFGGNISLTGNDEFAYSYSTDNGATWITAYGKSTGQQPLRLPVPGGYIDVDATNANNGDTIEAGTQVLIHPRRADLGYEVLKDTYIDVNRVGTEIFGGYYDDKPTLSDDTNLFNIMGDFIAALEFNNQEGCQEAYSKLSTCLEYVTTQTSRTGALENRVSLAYDVNTSTLLSQEEVLSGTEDIDLTELLSKLTQQQTTYQTVLMSSSMIMNMGLMNYL